MAVDFGALAAERASATRMMMTIAQIVKHLDGSKPVRLLIAETETGYTLLCALWLAEPFGIADQHRDLAAVRDLGRAGAGPAHHRRGVAQPAFPRLSQEPWPAVHPVRLFRFGPLYRAGGLDLLGRAAAHPASASCLQPLPASPMSSW